MFRKSLCKRMVKLENILLYTHCGRDGNGLSVQPRNDGECLSTEDCLIFGVPVGSKWGTWSGCVVSGESKLLCLLIIMDTNEEPFHTKIIILSCFNVPELLFGFILYLRRTNHHLHHLILHLDKYYFVLWLYLLTYIIKLP